MAAKRKVVKMAICPGCGRLKYPRAMRCALCLRVDTMAQGALPRTPCPHPPGSEEKLAELTRRAERGEKLFHPRDNRGDLT